MKSGLFQIKVIFSTFMISASLLAAEPFKVVIDPGHGGKDPGAIGRRSKEKNINLDVALKLGQKIKSRNGDVKVIYTRSNDRSLGLQDRADIANRAKADLFISIHTNATKATSVRGTETYTLGLRRSDENLEVAKRENSVILLEDDYKVKYEGFDPNSSESYIMFEMMQDKHMDQSIRMASLIQDNFKLKARRLNRGVRQDVFLVLRNTGMPSVLVELGFISNPEEEGYLMSESGQESLSESIYHAFREFKSEYDKRNGTYQITEKTTVSETRSNSVSKVDIATATTIQEKKSNNAVGSVIYKVQIMTHPKKLSPNSKFFKGLSPVDYYIENNQYKYTYGSSSSRAEMEKQRRKIAHLFKDAFVIKTMDNKRIK
ncbi:MAG: N-acetylmuramoyl-L-alanine amidase family protein [Bacteroidales bacterium]